MSAQFEYTVVALQKGQVKTQDRDTTELINRVAEHGWRLIAIQAAWSSMDKAHGYAYFERSVQSDV